MKPVAVLAALGLALSISSAPAATIGPATVFASGAAVGARGPDSIAVGGGSVWVSYTNGAESHGLSGSSLVVQYNTAGAMLHQYTIAGSVDGLQIDPNTGHVWALQNQDGNSAVTVIDPTTNTTQPLNYATTSATRGIDDVVFAGGKIFLSQSNPANPADATIVQLLNGGSPLTFSNAILTFGAPGTIQNDPDSLRLGSNGDLILTSGDDGALNFVSNPGLAGQSAHSIALNDAAGHAFSGLDDSLSPTNGAGIIYITDTGNNRVLAVSASGLTANSLFAAVGGSINAFGQVDPNTGLFTPLVSNLSAPHGLAFVATPEPSSLLLVIGGLAIVYARRSKRS